MSNWLNKLIPSLSRQESTSNKSKIPEGVWDKCKRCQSILYRPELERNLDVCPKCGYHFRLSARRRLEIFLNLEHREELFAELEPQDRLKFRDIKKYKDRIAQSQKSTGEKEALVCMRGLLEDVELVALASGFEFMGGSMGSAEGEKFVRAAEYCLTHQLPLVCFAVSGGARMQESLFSLMQMARTAAVVEKMRQAGLPFISVLTDPVYGGVTASYAMLGDLNIAEPGASVGFAGPRVIEQTVREKLPEGFQSSEFLLEHGTVDMIIAREEMRGTIARILRRLMSYNKNQQSMLLERTV